MLDKKNTFFFNRIEYKLFVITIKLSQHNVDKQTNKLSVSRKKISTPLINCTYNI
jgi:hypothetical protein